MFIDRQTFSGEAVDAIGRIDAFRGMWSAAQWLAPQMLRELRQTTIVSSSGASTRIEGAKLSDEEVAELLGNLRMERFTDRDHAEVKGYIEVLTLIFDRFDDMALTENIIKGLHRDLLKHVEKDQHHHGEYKKLPNTVKAYDAETGKEIGVVFETTSPAMTPIEMERLVSETNAAWQENRHHKLIVIAEFIVRFLAIHPFEDGNGRLARLLSNLLLLKAGYDFVRYSSHEKIVEDNKDRYYLALRQAQGSFSSNRPDPTPWISFFLRCLIKQVECLEAQVHIEKRLGALSPAEREIVELARQRGRITNQMVVQVYGCNPNTVKAHFQRLTASGVLLPRGKGKGRSYELARPLAAEKKEE